MMFKGFFLFLALAAPKWGPNKIYISKLDKRLPKNATDKV
jgi:hypothetical protein